MNDSEMKVAAEETAALCKALGGLAESFRIGLAEAAAIRDELHATLVGWREVQPHFAEMFERAASTIAGAAEVHKELSVALTESDEALALCRDHLTRLDELERYFRRGGAQSAR